MNSIKNINSKKVYTSLFIITVITIICFLSINGHAVEYKSDSGFVTDGLAKFLEEYKMQLNVFMGFVLVSNFAIFIYHLCRLGFCATSPQERSATFKNLLICGVCLALNGGLSVVYCILFYTFAK